MCDLSLTLGREVCLDRCNDVERQAQKDWKGVDCLTEADEAIGSTDVKGMNRTLEE